MSIFRYPFNKYGFYDYIENPMRQILKRQKVFKNIELWNFDLCEIYETVFAQFEYFCKANPFYFMKQYCREVQGIKDLMKHSLITDESIIDDKLEAYRRLSEIQEYVLHTRKLNETKLDYIGDVFHSSYKSKWIPSEKYKDCLQYTTDDFFYLKVDFWFERDELIYSLEKVNEKTNFNPLDIEDEITKLDKKFAKEIIELSGYIWN